MTAEEQPRPLIIVGANVPGLILAADLLRYGIQPFIIDGRSSATGLGSQVSLNGSSLELFAQLGLLDALLEKGLACGGLTIQVEGKVVAVESFSVLASPYPFHLNIDQHLVEELLIQYLARKACPVYWDTSVAAFRQNEKQVFLELKGRQFNGPHTFSWMLIADGDQFDVKRYLNAQYRKATSTVALFRLSVHTGEVHNRNQHVFVNRKGLVFSSPQDSRGYYTFLCSDRFRKGEFADFSRLKTRLDEALGFSIPVERPGEATWTRVSGERVSDVKHQRCILFSKAAYPANLLDGLLINQGIADARGMGWKLANVLRGIQSESILLTIDPERREAVLKQFKALERGWQLASLYRSLPFQGTESLINRFLAKRRGRTPHLRDSSLSLHHSRSKRIQAGDPLPFLPLYDEKKKELSDLHQCCSKPGFVLLLVGTLNPNGLFIMAQWMKQKYQQHMHLFYLPYSPKNQAIFDAFEVDAQGTKMVLVRPDRYIAYMHDTVGANLIDTYMIEVMKWRF